MNYFAIIYENDCKITGPHLNWKLACQSEFGFVDVRMKIKSLGENYDYATKSKHLERLLNDQQGWFAPLILDKTRTLDLDQAFGPPEIVAKLSSYPVRIRATRSIEELDSVKYEYLPFIRATTLELCKDFDQLYNYERVRLLGIEPKGLDEIQNLDPKGE